MKNNYFIGIKLFVFLFILTGLLYPLSVTIISKAFMPSLTNGSFLEKNGKIIGSKLISQNSFVDQYFWPRPSAINYNPSLPSGGTHLGPTNQDLLMILNERKKIYGNNAPIDLIYASGSGLDPHISIESAYYQIPRISQSRSLTELEIKKLIDLHTEGMQFGFIGPKYVNVLLLNLALDEIDVRRK